MRFIDPEPPKPTLPFDLDTYRAILRNGESDPRWGDVEKYQAAYRLWERWYASNLIDL